MIMILFSMSAQFFPILFLRSLRISDQKLCWLLFIKEDHRAEVGC